MYSESIFHKIVRDENDYTQLLCNLMTRVDEFRCQVLNLFLPMELAVKVPANVIQTQINIRDKSCLGRPDVEILWDEIRIFVEVKIHAWTGITENQDVTALAKKEFDGYLGSLSRSPEKSRWLVYLVPQRWNYCAVINRSRADETGILSAANIRIETIFWEDVLKLLEDDKRFLDNPLLQEFAALLFAHLELIRFKVEEADMLFSKDFAIGYRSIRKTERLIDQVRAMMEEKFADLVIDSTDKKGRFQEYGLYTKTKHGQDLLWVGVWPDFSEQHPYPISIGVYHADDKDEKLHKAFLAAWPDKTVEFDG
jgi:hypothetical protein